MIWGLIPCSPKTTGRGVCRVPCLTWTTEVVSSTSLPFSSHSYENPVKPLLFVVGGTAVDGGHKKHREIRLKSSSERGEVVGCPCHRLPHTHAKLPILSHTGRVYLPETPIRFVEVKGFANLYNGMARNGDNSQDDLASTTTV